MRDIKTRREVLKTARVIGRKKRIARRTVLGVLLVIFFGGTLYLCNSSFLRISDVIVHGSSVTQPDVLEQVVRREISGRYAFVVPRDNILFYPQVKLTQLVRRSNPALAAASVNLNAKRELVLEVTERAPDFLWCNIIDEENKRCYFMDKNGVAYMESPQFSDNVFIEIIGRTKDDPLGKMTIAKEEFLALRQVVQIIPSLTKDTGLVNDSIYKVVSLGGGDYNIFFHHNTADGGQNWHIIVNLKQQATDILAAFSTVVQSEIFKKDTNGTERGLDYIDLRFGKKIFYKFK